MTSEQLMHDFFNKDDNNKDIPCTVVLDTGNIHNFVFDKFIGDPVSITENSFIMGNILIEKWVALINTASKKCEIKIDQLKILEDMDSVAIEKLFIKLPRKMLVSISSIAIIEQSAHLYLEGDDQCGNIHSVDHEDLLNIFPHWKRFYSSALSGFFSTPPLIKGTIGNLNQDDNNEE